MISVSLAIWPCSDPAHKECWAIVDTLPLVLEKLDGKRRKLSYLSDHLNYEHAKHTIAAEIVIALNEQDRWWDRYGIEACKDSKHHDCFNIYDIKYANLYVGMHMTYIRAIATMYDLWKGKEQAMYTIILCDNSTHHECYQVIEQSDPKGEGTPILLHASLDQAQQKIRDLKLQAAKDYLDKQTKYEP